MGIEIITDFKFPYYVDYSNKINTPTVKASLNLYYNKIGVSKDLRQDKIIISDDGYSIWFYEKGYYWIDKSGTTVYANFYDKDDILLTFSNLPLSLISLIYGAIPLHCNSILNSNGEVCLLLGEKGIGKSTLSYYLYKKGVTVFSDDVTIVWPHNNGISLYNGLNTLKMVPNIKNDYCEEAHLIKEYKYFINLCSDYVECSKIKKIYILTHGNRLNLKRISYDLCKFQLKLFTIANCAFRNLVFKNYYLYEKIIENSEFFCELTINHNNNTVSEITEVLFNDIF